MDGLEHKMRLEDVVIVRNRYDGSGMSGSGMEAIEKVLQLQDYVDEGVQEALTISNKIHGILHQKKAMLSGDDVKKSQAAFIERMKEAARDGGIVVTDSMEEYKDINVTPYNVNAATSGLITGRLYAFYQTPLEVVNNTASEQIMQNYYTSVIEPWWLSLAQALTNALFTRTQRDYGNKIVIYGAELAGASWQTKLNILDKVKETGDLTRNERREILGYPPVDGGDEFEVSLNFIQGSDQSAYQMGKMAEEQEDTTNEDEDNKEDEEDAGET
jgi:phage portal protein BeeE